ncbi:LRR receptor-like serine/threonine-protein kinase fls2 [Orobanche gracilis]
MLRRFTLPLLIFSTLLLKVLSLQPTLETQIQALKAFRNSITADPSGVLLDWNETNHHCNWSGISCDPLSENVVSVTLVDRNLQGQISPFLGNLSDLQVLDLTLNSFTGIIPPQLGAIPQTLGGLKNLQLLDLGDNLFNGSIPPSLCNCTSLLQLGLINNNLTGLIPACIGNLVQLQLFVSFGNKLQGSIPPSIGKLKEIQVLDLSENQLSGKIPTEIGNLSNLEILQMHVNSLSVWSLKSLIYLGLSENQLEGTISLELAYLSSLQILTLHSNNFSGPLPPTITKLSNLTYLSIGFNSFAGSLPDDMGLLYNLKNLTANDNLLSGSIPASIANCTGLLVLTLTHNRIAGRLPDGLGQLSNLTYISLGDNVLSGNIPDDIFDCTQLQVLDLSRNNLNGTLKPNISKLVNLRTLKVWSNSFSGQIPKEIASLSHLIYLEIRGNRFSGPIPPVLSTLTFLQGLALNDNQLQGTIPAELSELKRLIDLRLQNNKLVGPIPGTISQLESLAYLDLSGNKLNGTIPRSLAHLFRLTALDLSHNHFTGICQNLISLDLSGNSLSGSVPGEIFPQLSQLVSLNLSRNQLNGTLPETMSNSKHLSTIDLSSNKLSGDIPEGLANISSLKYLNLFHNMLEGHVPETGVFMNMISTDLEGNPGLCGATFLKKCKKKNRSSDSRHFSKKALILISAPGCVLALIVMLSASYTIRKTIRKRSTGVKNSKIEFPSAGTLRRFDAKDIAIATSSFSPENIIGSSALSTVYKGTLQDGQKVAVKKLNLRQFAAESDKCFYREVDILGRLRHRNLVKVIDIIHDLDRDHPSWTLIKRIDVLVSIASGLVYLHSGYDFPIVHCDLKPSNVLLDGDLEAHVSDFGTARILGVCLEDGSSVSSSSAFEGTIGYLAPEFAYMRKVTTKVDVFSFGIIIMELITRKRPTGLTDDDGFPITLSQLVEQALERGIDGLDQVLDSDLTSCDTEKQEVLEGLLHLALSCTSAEPDIRPDMEQVSCSLSKIRKMA